MAWILRAANVFRQNWLLRRLDDELAFHVAERIDDLVAGGMTPDEARTEALRRFGNYTRQRERTRDMNIVAWLEGLVADIKFGARQLVLNPGFTTVAVLSLALGVGANTAIFQLINALRLRSLPAVEAPWQLATLVRAPEFHTSGWYSSRHQAFTYAQYQAVRRSQEAFTDVLAFGPTRFNLARGGEARYAEGLWVSSNFLDVLGVRPAIGSGFARVADESDCSKAGVMLSHAFWQREYGGKTSVLGQEMYLRGRTLPIVGVTPREFIGLEPGRQFDVAIPLCMDTLFAQDPRGRRLERRDAWWLTMIGRLKPEWNVTKASAHIAGMSSSIFRDTLPASYRPAEAKNYLKNRFLVEDASAGLSSLHRAYKDPLWILLTVAGLVLLIACANLANLLLARASARQREMAVRQAVGASRARLIAQLCTESLLLAGLGTVLGLAIAHVAGRALIAFLTNEDQPIVLALGFDRNLFLFTTGLAVLTCLLFGVAPAFKATSVPPAAAMSGARGTAQAAERHRLRRALVVAQVALSLVLLCGALLFAQTLRNLLTADSGMVPEGVLVASVDASLPDVKPDQRHLVFDQIQERIAAQPGVVSVAQVTLSPFGGSGWNGTVRAQGKGDSEGKESWFNSIGPGYFGTLKTPVMAGRDFTAQDTASSVRVAIVNEQFAKVVFGGENPIGRVFRHEAPAGEPEPEYQVVGLVRNTKYNGLREEFRAIAFLPVAQEKDPSDSITFLVRSRVPLGTTMAGIRQLMTEIQQGLLVEFRVLDDQVAQTVLRERLMATVSGAFGILAIVLSTIGLYGVMSYMVARRRNEIGVRLALGASSDHVLKLIFYEAGRLVLIGLVVGLAGAWWGGRYAESLIYGLKVYDPRTLALGCVLLACTGALAALVPALRALRFEPAVVLRAE
jgi:putative ABC transport system permease protein